MRIIKDVFILLIICLIIQSEIPAQPDNPKDQKLLDKLIGTWSAKSINRNRTEGNTPANSKLDEATSMGTNIRIYNEKEQKWYMGWIDTFNYKLLSFTATEKDGKLTMEGHDAQGRPIRNVFFNVTENSFDWAQQWTFDEGKTWVDVAKIWCTRWEG